MERPNQEVDVPQSAEKETIRFRSQYVTNDDPPSSSINIEQETPKQPKQPFGFYDRCCRKQHPSSFTTAISVEMKRTEGLIIDNEERNTKLERVFDFFLVLMLWKRPRICGNERVARASFICLQLILVFGMVFFAFFFQIQPMFCQNGLLLYQCPLIQNRLRDANLTVTSNVDAQIIAVGWHDLKYAPINTFVTGIGYTYDFVENNKLSSHSLFWNTTLTESERDVYRFTFIEFRAATVINRLLLLACVCMITISVAVSFRTHNVDRHGKNSILYPAVLVRHTTNDSFQFVRRRKFVMETALICSLGLDIVVYLVAGRDHVERVLVIVLIMYGLCMPMLTGFLIQKDNVNVLAMSLTECNTATDFVEWKNTLYKPTVALLHLWSRNLSSSIVVAVVYVISMFIWLCHTVVILIVQVGEGQSGIQDTTKESIRSKMRTFVALAMFFAVTLLALLVGLSMTSMNYQGLKIVLASLDLPNDLKKTFDFEDFEYLQEYRGALTVYGFPVTLSRSVELFKFVCVTSVLSVVSLGYASPY